MKKSVISQHLKSAKHENGKARLARKEKVERIIISDAAHKTIVKIVIKASNLVHT